jgi:hypothetical protein
MKINDEIINIIPPITDKISTVLSSIKKNPIPNPIIITKIPTINKALVPLLLTILSFESTIGLVTAIII